MRALNGDVWGRHRKTGTGGKIDGARAGVAFAAALALAAPAALFGWIEAAASRPVVVEIVLLGPRRAADVTSSHEMSPVL